MSSRRAYSIDGVAPVASPTKTLLGSTGGTTWRSGWFFLAISSSASPADNAITWFVQRSTAAGTSTAVTPQKLDGSFIAALSTAGFLHSAEPTGLF